jgi:predicted phosphate transport protein (TIGR00153 family)
MKFIFFLPKQPIFFNLFVKLSKEVSAIAKTLDDLTKINNVSAVDLYVQQAKTIEHRADDITHEVIDRLNRTFVTPFDREDIYNLTEELDDIIDRIENVVHNFAIYRVNPHEPFFMEFAALIIKDAEYLSQLTDQLKQQRYSSTFKELIYKIHTIEDQGDEVFLKTLTHLFKNGQNALEVIKLKDITEDLEEVIDKFQDASNTFENILVKSQ